MLLKQGNISITQQSYLEDVSTAVTVVIVSGIGHNAAGHGAKNGLYFTVFVSGLMTISSCVVFVAVVMSHL